MTAGPAEEAAVAQAIAAGEQAHVTHQRWAEANHAVGSETLVDPAPNQADETAVDWPKPPSTTAA